LRKQFLVPLELTISTGTTAVPLKVVVSRQRSVRVSLFRVTVSAWPRIV
jgi:hypothetical protein